MIFPPATVCSSPILTDTPHRALAIIPARGGSKRLPRKNVIEFRGKPMIAHTVESALASATFEKIIVSSDDDEILAVAQAYDVETMKRGMALSDDEARVVDVCLDTLDTLEDRGERFDVFACLYATAPLRSADDISATVNLIEPESCEFAMAVTAYPFPPHQALKRERGGALRPMWPELVNRRASDIGELVVDNGSTYACAVTAFRTARSFYGPGLRGHVMDAMRSVDIDTADDLALASFYADRLDA